MTRILLINPNTAEATTAEMVAIANAVASEGTEVSGATARHGPKMILQADELRAAVPEVMNIGLAASGDTDGIIIGAFGDPGVAQLRRQVSVPVIGIAEASMREAAEGGRRFGIATTTPALVEIIAAYAARLGLADLYAGIRLTPGDPLDLVADPPLLVEALAEAVRHSIECDEAEAVVIGGGPLGQAAIAVAARFATPIIAPVPAAMRRLMRLIVGARPATVRSSSPPPDARLLKRLE
jgi:allantoin racemase